MSFWFYTLMIVFVLVCLFLMLLILIQKGRGGGLASAFGGAGGNTAFGSKTGDVLTWATSIVFGVFLLLAVGLNLLANSINAREIATPLGGVPMSETTSDMTLPAPQPQIPPPTGLPPGVSGDDAPVQPQPPDGPTELSDTPAGAAPSGPANPAPVEAPPTTQPQ